MNNELKKNLYNYFVRKENRTPEEETLAMGLLEEMQYADLEGMCVSIDDLNELPNAKSLTRKDLCQIANEMDDLLADEFGPALKEVLKRATKRFEEIHNIESVMKIKTFKFWMSNYGLIDSVCGKDERYIQKAQMVTPVATASEIDNTINGFIQDKEVVNILINDFVCDRHNNGGSDIVQRTYTILYK